MLYLRALAGASEFAWTAEAFGAAGGALLGAKARKAIVVCPATLVGNWSREYRKWFGSASQLAPTAVGEAEIDRATNRPKTSRQQVADFLLDGGAGKSDLLIISYESFARFAPELNAARVGALVCDEGHRLKNASGSKTTEALRRSPARTRLLLTGTPVQNDLKELFDGLESSTYKDFKELLRKLYGCKKQSAACDARYKSAHDFV